MALSLERDPTSGSLGMSGGDHIIFFTALDERETVGSVAVHWEGLSGSVDMLVVSFEGGWRAYLASRGFLSVPKVQRRQIFVQQTPSYRDAGQQSNCVWQDRAECSIAAL